jgi:cytoskeletal protein CcmA (bactofilin family)
VAVATHSPVAVPMPVRAYAGPSMISSAMSLVGRLESTGDMEIDGKIEGEIIGRGVRIGSSGAIKGTIKAETVQLAGTVEGKIEAQTVILAKTAIMKGDVFYQSLQIEEGASMNGNCRPHYKA